jgi:hypothetical protein
MIEVDKRYEGPYIGARPRVTGGAVGRGKGHDARWTPPRRPLGVRTASEVSVGGASARQWWVEDRVARARHVCGSIGASYDSGQWLSSRWQCAGACVRAMRHGKACSDSGR